MDCPQLTAMLDQVEGNCIPFRLREPILQHLEECRHCRADITNFLKIGKILQRTVYGEPNRDNILRYLDHLTGKNLNWECKEGDNEKKRRNVRLLLLKIVAGFIAAAGLGASVAMLLGHFGLIGGRRESKVNGTQIVEVDSPAAVGEAQVQLERHSALVNAEENKIPVVVPEGGLDPAQVYRYLDHFRKIAEQARQAAASFQPPDSTHLRGLEAQLAAMHDAIARTPNDLELRQRMMDKYREMIEERKRVGGILRVSDYYNLGFMHYANGEYPQTAIVTAEGLRMVRFGPTQYLHYLKGMSHYQIGLKALNPLPPDSSASAEARVAGEIMRAELDTAARKRAVREFREAITEFGNLLSNPELEPSARQLILECNSLIEKAALPS